MLIDVSGSLRAHSADLLRFAHVVLRAAERGEAFTFGTRLTRVTTALSARDVDTRARRASRSACSTPTAAPRSASRCSEFLANRRYVAGARGALIIVISDGLERGDPAPMADAAARLVAARAPADLVVAAGLLPRVPAGDARHGRRCSAQLDHLGGARDLATLLDEVRRLPETGARPRRLAAPGECGVIVDCHHHIWRQARPAVARRRR